MKPIKWIFFAVLAAIAPFSSANNNALPKAGTTGKAVTTPSLQEQENLDALLGSWRLGSNRMDLDLGGQGTFYNDKRACYRFLYMITNNVMTSTALTPNACSVNNFVVREYFSVINGVLTLQNVQTKSVSLWVNSASGKRNSEESFATTAVQNAAYNDGFPDHYVSIHPQTGMRMQWRRHHENFGQLSPDPSFDLIYINEGSAVIYTTESSGATMQLAGELNVMMTAGRGAKMILKDKPQTPTQHLALLHKKNGVYTLLPLNYSANNAAYIFRTYDAIDLTSSFDVFRNRYLLFSPSLPFKSDPSDKTFPTWEHFDAWWFDAKNDTIEHMVLPAGPWVSDAKKDGLLLRDMRNFSCGVGCYRHYEITAENGNIFVSISGLPSAIHEKVTGKYMLSKDGASWKKVNN